MVQKKVWFFKNDDSGLILESVVDDSEKMVFEKKKMISDKILAP